MQVTALGNCPATLLADPMAVDADSFRAYIDATVAAGFDSLSLWPFHLTLAGADAVDVTRRSGLRVEAVEAAIGWTGGATDAAIAEIDGLVSTGSDLGARIVGAACLGPIDDLRAAAEGLAGIAGQASEANMLVALEFLPWTGVPTFSAANQLIVDSGADNATVLLDTFHWCRQEGGPDLATLRSIPGSRVAYVQLSEPAAVAYDSVEEEAMTARRPPGSGGVDYDAIWEALDHIGSDPFVAAEVFSTELAASGPTAMAKTVHDACRGVLPPLAR